MDQATNQTARTPYPVVVFGMAKYRDWQSGQIRDRSYYIIRELRRRSEIGSILYVDSLPVRRAEALRDYAAMLGHVRSTRWISPFSALETVDGALHIFRTVWSVLQWPRVYRDLAVAMRRVNVSRPLLWSYYPLNVDFLNTVSGSAVIFDLDRDWQRRPDLRNDGPVDYQNALRQNYNAIASHADVIFTASDALLELFMGHDRAYWVTDCNETAIEKMAWPSIVDEMLAKINETVKPA